MKYKNEFLKYFLISFVTLFCVYETFNFLAIVHVDLLKILIVNFIVSLLISLNTTYWNHIRKNQ